VPDTFASSPLPNASRPANWRICRRWITTTTSPGGYSTATTPQLSAAGFASDDEPSAADVAVTVLDDYQRRGIGRMLIEVLAVSARARGVGVLHFDVLAENEGMLGLLRSLGAIRTGQNGVVHLVLDVHSVPAPDMVDGDLIGLLEAAHRSAASSVTPDPTPG
jgi:GNAT superfamily N-acetyltransferase